MTLHLLRRRRIADDNPGRKAPTTEEKAGRLKEAGQIIAIFALMLTALIGLVGIAIDVTYAWREELRVQRAADAAALAGVVYLPGDIPGGISAAQTEAGKNGFTGVSAQQSPGNPRQMDVTVSGQSPTFFLRALGWDHFDISRHAHAVFILPVPMGSPDPYYGAYGTYKMCSSGSGPSCPTTPVGMSGPNGESIAGRKFWATMLTQGAGTLSGDAYMPKKLNANQTGSSPVNPQRDTTNYYDYAIWMPPGSTNGHVHIFDAVFCATSGRLGAGDYWLSGTAAVSSYFKLYNTNNQPYNPAAHTYLGSSGSLFVNNQYYDPKAGASSGGTSCQAGSTTNPSDPRFYHNKWYDLSGSIGGAAVLQGGTSGTMYRLRTTSDPGNSSQDSANAYNDFAIYVSASGSGTPQVYGIGAMEMYSLLDPGGASEFYLAQIDAQAGAGKTVEIRLFDAGDTNGLTANLQVLAPTGSGWSPASMTWTVKRIGGSAPCGSGSGTSIVTFNGTKQYDGCWLNIRVVVPTTYSAPQNGWWKIRYNMGSGSDSATDLTTWQVDIRGNPVHLIP